MDERSTPVGTSFMSRFVDFETVEEGAALAGGGGGGGDFPAPAIPPAEQGLVGDDGTDLGDPNFDPDGGGELEETPPAGWGGPSQDEWNGVMQGMSTLGQLLEYLQEEPAPAGEQQPSTLDRLAAGEVDMSDPETFRSAVAEEANRLLDERLGPYQPILEQQAQQTGEKMVKDALESIAGEIGEFDRNHALIATQSLLANGVPAEQAFRQAAAITQQFEQRIRQEAVAEYQKSLGNVDDVPAEPAGGGGVAQETETFQYDPRDPDKYEQLAQRFLARRQAAQARTTG